ncbi:MAG TPA: calcium-binding protein [Allosphingosinicella sp.]|nr:calcium-binding protein [Allosphingosinicella sp.]
MAIWQTAGNGIWTNASAWDGPTPNGAGAVAEFIRPDGGEFVYIIVIPEGTTITVGTLNILSTATDGWSFRGASGDEGAVLRFLGASGGPAFINVDSNGSGLNGIANGNGLEVVFASDVILTTTDSDTRFKINAPIVGPGDLYKFGAGTLELKPQFGDTNSEWTGGLHLRGGRTETIEEGVAEVDISLGNGAVLTGSGTYDNRIELISGNNSGTIATQFSLTLSGLLVHSSNNPTGLRFGTATDTGTIILVAGNFVLGSGGFTIAGGTVQFGNAAAAANYFASMSPSGLLSVVGTLDTGGFAANLDNLDLDSGTLLASSGALDVIVTDRTTSTNSQAGTIQGTAGADRFTVNVVNDFNMAATIFTNWTAGVDTITVNGGESANTLLGSARNDVLNGNGGSDTLRGGGGADVLRGGAGGDIYELSDGLDTLVELAGEGTDRVVILSGGPTSFTLGENFENLTFANDANNTGIGNGVANILIGGGGNDLLDGRAGADRLEGGAGNDSYFIDNAADVVVEALAQGIDRIYASVSYILGAGVAVETLSTADNAGTASLALAGNEYANTIIGNAGANILSGGGSGDVLDGKEGSDLLYGEAGNDTLYGRDGNDLLHGGAGTNYLDGGLGNDQYVIESNIDIVAELAGQGTDRVFASVSYILTAGASVETLSTSDNAGTGAINLTGNELADTIMGNAGANVLNGRDGNDILDGKEGADTLYGGANNDVLYGRDGNDLLSGGAGANHLDGGLGNDQYLIDSASDVIAELADQGADRVYASVSYTLAAGVAVEALSTIDNAGTAAINLTGNALANTLFGNAGANVLNGGGGADMLDGKGGADTYAFTSALGPGHVAVVLGFQTGVDKIALENAVFTGLAAGALPAGAFVVGTAAGDADDRIVYNNTTGALLFDADGAGGAAAILFATLSGAPALAASDLLVI